MLRFLFISLLIFAPVVAFAQGSTPLTTIPAFTEIANSRDISGFLNTLYKLCIGAAAVLAVIQIIRGGLTYMLGDSVTEKKEATHHLRMAIFGLLLVLSPAIVFGIIDQRILSLEIGLDELQTGNGTGGEENGSEGGTGEEGDNGDEGQEEDEGDGECEQRSPSGQCVGGSTEGDVPQDGEIAPYTIPFSGYAYILYREGTCGTPPNTYACTNVTINDEYQTPQACRAVPGHQGNAGDPIQGRRTPTGDLEVVGYVLFACQTNTNGDNGGGSMTVDLRYPVFRR